jgi:hypothetical protein
MVILILTSNRVSNSAMAFQSLEQMTAMHHKVQKKTSIDYLPICLGNARENQDNQFTII